MRSNDIMKENIIQNDTSFDEIQKLLYFGRFVNFKILWYKDVNIINYV